MLGVFFVYARVGLVSPLTGLILAHIMLALPYVIIALLAGLRNFDMSQEMVARSLGMNRFRAFAAVGSHCRTQPAELNNPSRLPRRYLPRAISAINTANSASTTR